MWRLVWRIPYGARLRFMRWLGNRVLPGQMLLKLRELSPDTLEWAAGAMAEVERVRGGSVTKPFSDLRRKARAGGTRT